MREAAVSAGDMALEMMKAGQARHWHKEPGSPITEADLAVNRYIASALRSARPGYGWLSEETVDRRSDRASDRVWVVDPIDGTKAYIRANDPYWCVAIALVEHGHVIAGVLYAPELDMRFEASLGGGAFLNGQQLSVSDCTDMPGCKMITNKAMLTHPAWPEPWPRVELADPKPVSYTHLTLPTKA